MDLSSAFGKKVGDFKKKESESLIFTGLEIINIGKEEILNAKATTDRYRKFRRYDQ